MNAPTHLTTFTSHQMQRGFSLIELMIAITLGLMILVALSVLFVDQSRTRNELDKSNRMIDNGRYAMGLLSENLQMAGFYDDYVPSGTPTAIPDPCNKTTLTTSTTNLDVLLHPVQGYSAATGKTGVVASLPTSCAFTYTAGDEDLSLRSGSDLLVVHRAATTTPVATDADSTIYLQTSKCVTDLVKYQISDTLVASIHDKNCMATAPLRPFLVQVYFVAPDNKPGDGIPTLKRRELDVVTGEFVTTPLVEGIEYMRIEYGVDGDNNADGTLDTFIGNSDGAPDSYTRTPTAATWPHVMSARITLIARNTEASTGYTDTKSYDLGLAGTYSGFNDKYKRHAFTQVVRLVNPSSRRELP